MLLLVDDPDDLFSREGSSEADEDRHAARKSGA
jgi:hypothetical protein